MSVDTSTIVGISVTASVVGLGLGWLMMRNPSSSSPVIGNEDLPDFSKGHNPPKTPSVYQRPIHSNNNNKTVKLYSPRANSRSSRSSRSSRNLFSSVNSGDDGFFDAQEGPQRGGKKNKNKNSLTKLKLRSKKNKKIKQ